MKQFKAFNIQPKRTVFLGEKIKIDRILNKEISVHAFTLAESKYKGNLLSLQIKVNGEFRVVFTGSKVLIDMITQVQQDDFPFTTTIVKENEFYEFT